MIMAVDKQVCIKRAYRTVKVPNGLRKSNCTEGKEVLQSATLFCDYTIPTLLSLHTGESCTAQ